MSAIEEFELQKCKEKLERAFSPNIAIKIINGNRLQVIVFVEEANRITIVSSVSRALKELGLEIICETCGISAYIFLTKKEV